MKKIEIIMIIIIFSFSSIKSFSNLESNEIYTEIDSYMNSATEINLFNGSILVAENGNIVISKGYGMANFEFEIPNSSKTIFRTGSLTKQFTAVAILQLEEKGLLQTSDKISKYFPEFPNGDKITIENLLTHTSGIFSYTNIKDYKIFMKLQQTPKSLIQLFKDKPLDFLPGSEFSYNNSGYVLLGLIIEKVSGKTYEEYLTENIFNKLNMNNTGIEHNKVVTKNFASGYAINSYSINKAEYIDMSITYACGSIYSTVEDLYKWDQALYYDKILNAEEKNKMFNSYAELIFYERKTNYGYGWLIQDFEGHKKIFHRGDVNGFTSEIIRYIDDNKTIIILTNLDVAQTNKIADTISSILFKKPYSKIVRKEIVNIEGSETNKFIGKYKLDSSNTVTIIKEKETLIMKTTDSISKGNGDTKFIIYPMSTDSFFTKSVNAIVKFKVNKENEVNEISLIVDGNEIFGKRIK